jgi:hypothetical protein
MWSLRNGLGAEWSSVSTPGSLALGTRWCVEKRRIFPLKPSCIWLAASCAFSTAIASVPFRFPNKLSARLFPYQAAKASVWMTHAKRA